MNNQKKIIYVVLGVILFSIILYFYRVSMQESTVVVGEVDNSKVLETVFEPVELKSQKDFKMIGQNIYSGSGFEPGFNFKISLAGTKFGTDLTSQYGDTHYVGYLDIVEQSTSTKVFSGKMLDKKDQVVDGEFKILTKKCNMPSGDEVPYTVVINVSNEKLSGCADLVSN
jgi:hypothetical protein